MAYYRVDSRQQDEGWIEDTYYGRTRTFPSLESAIRYAEESSRDPLYGMARVIDVYSNHVVIEYGAGHAPYNATEMRQSLRNRCAFEPIAAAMLPATQETRQLYAVDPPVRLQHSVPDTAISSTPLQAGERNQRLIRIRERQE